jgi:hypothetical protein
MSSQSHFHRGETGREKAKGIVGIDREPVGTSGALVLGGSEVASLEKMLSYCQDKHFEPE